MPGTFPSLRTGAVAQFPLAREVRYSNEVVRFMDGSEQSYRLAPAALRRWSIDLAQLDATEVSALRRFFEEQKGSWGTFTFVDPLTGTPYESCSFQDDTFPEQRECESRASASLAVYEHA